MENRFHIYDLIHDSCLADIARDTIQNEDIDVGFEFVGLDGSVDARLPKFDRDLIRHQLPLAGVFQESSTHLGSRVERAEDIAAGNMEEARNRAKGTALCSLAAARRAEKKVSDVFH